MRAMASEVTGKPVGPIPDIRLSAARVQQEITRYYQGLGVPVAAQASDIRDLCESLASILAPLYEDIRETFAAHNQGIGEHVQLQHGEA
jgi:hypothetical protein